LGAAEAAKANTEEHRKKGGAYQMLLIALMEAERVLPDEYLDVLGLTR